jgi:hypothetical protein
MCLGELGEQKVWVIGWWDGCNGHDDVIVVIYFGDLIVVGACDCRCFYSCNVKRLNVGVFCHGFLGAALPWGLILSSIKEMCWF